MKSNNLQVTLTLYFEGGVHLTKVRDKQVTKLQTTETDMGVFPGCVKHSVDVNLNRNTCKMDIILSAHQINNTPSNTALRSIGINPRNKNAAVQWKRMDFESKSHIHASDFMHDRGAVSYELQIK